MKKDDEDRAIAKYEYLSVTLNELTIALPEIGIVI